jgi:prevent-host-death family protein
MKTMAISAFKARALQVVAQVARSKERVVITKHGKPMAQLVPYSSLARTSVPGKLASALVFEKDIVSPLGAKTWEAAH